MLPNQNRDVLEHPDTVAIREHEITPLKNRVDKCYSAEKYEEFQTAVKKITLETMGNDEGRKKIKDHATEATKEYLNQATWEKAKFWIPTLIALIGTAIAIYSALKPN